MESLTHCVSKGHHLSEFAKASPTSSYINTVYAVGHLASGHEDRLAKSPIKPKPVWGNFRIKAMNGSSNPQTKEVSPVQLEIPHVVAKRRLLNPFSTSQSTDVILSNLESVSKATHLDEFIQNTATLLLFQYRYSARLNFGPCGSEHADSLEVEAYRQGHEFLQKLSRNEPNLVVRPWPYLYERSSKNRPKEFYVRIFCGQGQEVVSEETAWGRLASGNTKFTASNGDGGQQPAIRRLNALIGQVNSRIKDPGSHHQSGQGDSRDHAASEKL